MTYLCGLMHISYTYICGLIHQVHAVLGRRSVVDVPALDLLPAFFVEMNSIPMLTDEVLSCLATPPGPPLISVLVGGQGFLRKDRRVCQLQDGL
jgi:hypothetical protein